VCRGIYGRKIFDAAAAARQTQIIVLIVFLFDTQRSSGVYDVSQDDNSTATMEFRSEITNQCIEIEA